MNSDYAYAFIFFPLIAGPAMVNEKKSFLKSKGEQSNTNEGVNYNHSHFHASL